LDLQPNGLSRKQLEPQMTVINSMLSVALGSLAIAWTGLAFTPAAHADPAKTFEVAFKYDRTAAAPATYASIKNQAVKACAREFQGGPLAFQARWMQSCRTELVDKAVGKIAMPELTALHSGASPSQVATR
jgi:hypothetical protein